MAEGRQSAIIAGAGIGGLTVALCLVHAGWDVTVLERAPALEEVGAGLQLSPNGMHVLSTLGLEEAVRSVACQPEAISMRLGVSGRPVFSLAAGTAMERRFGAPYLTLHRADLQRVLADALAERAPGALHLGQSVSGYRGDGAGAALLLECGAKRGADLVIGADGLQSTIRSAMLGPEAPRYTGQTAWRAIVSADAAQDLDVPNGPCIWAGKQRHAVTYPIRSGTALNFVGIVARAEPPAESWTASGRWEDLSIDFDGWCPLIQRIVGHARKPGQWALYDRPPISTPVDGAAVLLGDAWHPMLPSMAQGACQAIEDAWVLAASVRGTPVAEGLARYAAIRKPRVDRVQRLAAANLALFHKRTAMGRMLTYGPAWAAGQFAPALLNRRTDWIYGHDVTAA